MTSIGAFLVHGLRVARAPLASGAIVTLAVWIQLSDVFTMPWPGDSFASQLAILIENLSALGTASLLLLTIGVVGSISIRVSGMLLEPAARWWLSRWNLRVEVRSYQRENRWAYSINANSLEDAAYEEVEHESRHFRNAYYWLLDWFPSREARTRYRAENFWLEPKWIDRVLPWLARQINEAVEARNERRIPTESLAALERRLSENEEVKALVLALEHEIERDPTVCTESPQETRSTADIGTLIAENDFRIAVSPPLATLGLSIGLAWWAWALALVPLAIAVYGSALDRRRKITVHCLDRLLSDVGTCNALNQLKIWARREAHRLRSSGGTS